MIKKSGFTLVELLVVTSMIGLILVAVVGALSGTFRTQTKLVLSDKVNENGSFALEEIRKNILNIKSIGNTGPTNLGFTGIDGGSTNIICNPDYKKISSSSASRSQDIELISSIDLKLVDCTNFITYTKNIDGVVTNIDFKFTLGAGETLAGPQNYYQKTFNSKVTLRNLE
ncbi:MAG: type II secretion system protein [Candidatus Shapirobacteria bacterium]